MTPNSLEIRGVSKAFPGVQALDCVYLDVQRGEVHAIVGENGAGKSTLMKILAGALAPDAGQIVVHGQEVQTYSPEAARAHGIAIIFQEFNLVPFLTAAQNIALGREPGRWGWIQRARELEEAKSLLAEIGAEVPLRVPVCRLSVAQQQLVEIAKALAVDASILIMDEPASALSLTEREHLFALIGRLRDRGITILYVTHHLEEVFRLADRVTVLKDGRVVRTLHVRETDRDGLITMMVGRKLAQVFPAKASKVGGPVLTVEGLSSGREVRDVSFTLHKGEILGVYGLVGAGRTELCKALFGARPHSGQITVDGRKVAARHPHAAVAQGMAVVTEDRKNEGLVMGLSVRHNLALPNLGQRQRLGVIRRAQETQALQAMVEKLEVRPPDLETLTVQLSGGNQQKVVIGKWLLTKPKVLICDEPTRGVDVGAKVEIYAHLRRLAEQGMAILMVSSELPEVLGMSDRVLVMAGGRMVAEFSDGEATEERVMAAALADKAHADRPASASSGRPRGLARLGRWRPDATSVVLATLLALFLAGALSSPRFLGMYNLISILRSAVPLALVAMGQAMVMISGGVDLSVSATITLTTIIGATLIGGSDARILPAAVATLGVGLGMGVANGLAVTQLKIPPFIATLGMMSIGRGIVLVLARGPVGAIGRGFRAFSRGAFGPIPAALVILGVVFALAALVMNRTRYGRHLFALGGNREVARLAGIRTRWVELSSYLVSGVCAVIAGLYLTSRMGAGDPSVGPGLELDSIIAVLTGGIPFGGGRGNVLGVMAGVMLLTVLGNLLTVWNLSSWYHQIARALVLLAALAVFKKED
ncbi:MAG: ATP-binding cassette domain-containing protein [Candidatus Acetothermia bacterium]|nr:ATP-binding cassette domain-containing protein [Candidatus Acetothermia bacterium]